MKIGQCRRMSQRWMAAVRIAHDAKDRLALKNEWRSLLSISKL